MNMNNNHHSSLPGHRLVKKPLAILFATLLMTSTPQTVLAATSVEAANAFYDNANYTYCDIKLLSAYWGQSRFDSKVRAGEKLLRNEQYVVDDFLTSARAAAAGNNVSCSFADADNPPYTYEDAEVLADFWGQPDAAGAKTKIGSMLQAGDNKLVMQALNNARQSSGGSTQTNADQPALNAFFDNRNYTYCDVQLLTAYWGQSIYEVKVRAGSKLLAGAYNTMEDYRRSARNHASQNNISCSFADASNPAYTYQDAEKLAAYWGKPTPYDAKLKIGSMLQAGENKMVIQALQRAGNS